MLPFFLFLTVEIRNVLPTILELQYRGTNRKVSFQDTCYVRDSLPCFDLAVFF